MMNKKINVKRLLIFIGISFILTWIPMFIFLSFDGEYDNTNPATTLLCTFGMLCPAIGMLITRGLTKEGYELSGDNSLMLGISFANKKWIWYIAAFLIPIICWLIGDGLWFVLQPKTFDTESLNGMISGGEIALIPVIGIVTAFTDSFGALFEELGWRGYMYPKLEKLFGFRWAVLIGGVIWGVWHFPIVAAGHIGTGYFGEPYTGFLVFTVDCVFEGCILYMLTKKSGSIWPAALLHAFNNTGSNALMVFMNLDKATGIFKDGMVMHSILIAGEVVIGFFALFKSKKWYYK